MVCVAKKQSETGAQPPAVRPEEAGEVASVPDSVAGTTTEADGTPACIVFALRRGEGRGEGLAASGARQKGGVGSCGTSGWGGSLRGEAEEAIPRVVRDFDGGLGGAAARLDCISTDRRGGEGAGGVGATAVSEAVAARGLATTATTPERSRGTKQTPKPITAKKVKSTRECIAITV